MILQSPSPRLPRAPQLNIAKRLTLFPSPSFFSELQELDEKGLTAVHDRILVSDRVNVLLDLHIAVDGLEEKELGGSFSSPRLWRDR